MSPKLVLKRKREEADSDMSTASTPKGNEPETSVIASITPFKLRLDLGATSPDTKSPMVLSNKRNGINTLLSQEQHIPMTTGQAIGDEMTQELASTTAPDISSRSSITSSSRSHHLAFEPPRVPAKDEITPLSNRLPAEAPLSVVEISPTLRPGPSEQHEAKPFRFLELPPELRNMIYEKVMEEEPAILRRYTTYSSTCTRRLRGRSPRTKKINSDYRHGGRRLISRTSLCRTNHQLRQEFLSLSAAKSPEVRLEVVNFDFTRALSWLNSLSERDLGKFHAEDGLDAQRRIVIDLLSSQRTKNVSRPWLPYIGRMERWVRRLTSKKESKIDIGYKCNFEGRWVPFRPALDEAVRILRLSGDKRAIKEWNKIKKAWKEGAGFEW